MKKIHGIGIMMKRTHWDGMMKKTLIFMKKSQKQINLNQLEILYYQVSAILLRSCMVPKMLRLRENQSIALIGEVANKIIKMAQK